MRLILKTLWKNRKQNGWIFAEIALITALSWFMVDYLVVTQYSTHFCTPAGEFEKDHLCVGMFGILQNENETERQISTDEEAIGVYAIKNKLASLPEVQSVCLTTNYLGWDLRLYSWRTLSLIDDTTKTIGVAQQFYIPNQQYFETQGLQAPTWKHCQGIFLKMELSSHAAWQSSSSAPTRWWANRWRWWTTLSSKEI